MHYIVMLWLQHITNTVNRTHNTKIHKLWFSNQITDELFFYDIMPCQLINNYRRFKKPSSVHPTGSNSPQKCRDYFTLKMETLQYTETSVNIYQSTPSQHSTSSHFTNHYISVSFGVVPTVQTETP